APMRVRKTVVALFGLVLGACGSHDDHAAGAGAGNAGAGGAGNAGAGGMDNTGGAGSTGTGAAGNGGGTSSPDGGSSACEAFGHYGPPGATFTLPVVNGGIYYLDVQKSFPQVDWASVTRLYVPAGKYKEFYLGNLPKRDAAHPLVITNQGGQVQVG